MLKMFSHGQDVAGKKFLKHVGIIQIQKLLNLIPHALQLVSAKFGMKLRVLLSHLFRMHDLAWSDSDVEV